MADLQPKIQIRLANEDDLEEILELDRALLPWVKPSPDTSLWGAWIGADLVGYAGSRVTIPGWDGICFMSRAGVVEHARGMGLQKRLIRARVAHAWRHGCSKVVTYTATHNAPSANSLIACGFKIYEPAHAYAGASEIYWQKINRV